MDPALAIPTLKEFDARLERAFFLVLGFPDKPDCSAERLLRAELKASLPAPFGCGLFKAADFALGAWLGSFAACLRDDFVFERRKHALSSLHFVYASLDEHGAHQGSLQGKDAGLT